MADHYGRTDQGVWNSPLLEAFLKWRSLED
jgi:hypothetical protein